MKDSVSIDTVLNVFLREERLGGEASFNILSDDTFGEIFSLLSFLVESVEGG